MVQARLWELCTEMGVDFYGVYAVSDIECAYLAAARAASTAWAACGADDPHTNAAAAAAAVDPSYPRQLADLIRAEVSLHEVLPWLVSPADPSSE